MMPLKMGCDWVGVELWAGIRLETKEYPKFLLELIKDWKANNPGVNIVTQFSGQSEPKVNKVYSERLRKRQKNNNPDGMDDNDLLRYFLGLNSSSSISRDCEEVRLVKSACTKNLKSVIGNSKWRITTEAFKLIEQDGCDLKASYQFFGNKNTQDADSDDEEEEDEYDQPESEDDAVNNEKTEFEKWNKKQPGLALVFHKFGLEQSVPGPYESKCADGKIIPVDVLPIRKLQSRVNAYCEKRGIKKQYCLYSRMQ